MTTEPVIAEMAQDAGVADELPRRLEEARGRFNEWRKTRSRMGPIPEELWREAASCAAEYGAHRTGVVLGLDSGKLKRRLAPAKKGRKKTSRRRRPTFVEVAPAKPTPTGECVLEVESRTGTRLRIQLRGAALGDLAEFARRLTHEGS